MTTATEPSTTRKIQVAGLDLSYDQRGSGDPVVVLHHSTGNVGWIPFYDALAKSFTVAVPDMPGYGQSGRPDWAREPRDLAILLNQALDKVGITGGLSLVGLGYGGFVAAEMASMDRRRLKTLTLVGAPGVQPEEGEILDQMLVDFEEYVKAGFHDDEAYHKVFGEEANAGIKQLWDYSREMTARLTWKPYMFNRRLPALLKEVDTPTLLIWGSRDVIVPMSAAKRYQGALPKARLEVIEGSGHLVEFEEPERVAELVAAHVHSS